MELRESKGVIEMTGMTEQKYRELVSKPGRYQGFERVAVDEPAAKFKGKVTLTRLVKFTGRSGIRYERLAVIQQREMAVQPRKWGVRRDRWFVDHTPATGVRKGIPSVYATVFAVAGSFRTRYFVNGEEVARDAYNEYRTASAAKGKPLGPAGYMDIELSLLTPLVKHTLTEQQIEDDLAAEAEAEAAELAAAAA